ncbi:binding-protein-dependent transport systems inner membrane component [Beutenbergia cavernae DSM 12333]|uniref:Binding-protein-dependent transport systems inner membrane component n=1 Tax=Beutenbergia cavernae (strain ATCC BAA-8 / DSM 12333 / CCUG 43141 / JCM 11478 / NBRC 16432 / NCIMB 13614 / HKI 0122) TaxID=471853 RepID=C5BY14_BEUC1|nr:carbohydrate ABC transporter permease [Beutenbergia cavernae]ACQ78908.1 binding-protein-dependent transport systems inner membrane component [Beutenbergia cavernae DSM 12333]
MATLTPAPASSGAMTDGDVRHVVHQRPTRPWTRVPFYLVLFVLSVAFFAPILWMISTSFKTAGDATALPPQWIPPEFSTDGYTVLFSDPQAPVLRWLANSVLVGVAHTVLVLLTASLAAYSLARMTFPGKNVAFGLIVSTMFVPGFVFLMPNYLIVDAFDWLDTMWALVIPGAASAFGVFFLRQFFLSIPGELEEAAVLDGANRWQIFWRVVLPLSTAPLATLAVLSFLASWNDFLWPLYVLFNPESLTLPAGLATLRSAYGTDFPAIMAGAVLASIPVLLIYAFAQRYIIAGVSRSGLKG